ncbi:hypothetical protein [Acetobacter sp. LMG 32666]|uniref:hypothetical protein n=1 Tax=Acetobacter sp. LMG 32666 TaxID=2959295 RepID=UPI0030C824E8
MQSGKHGTAPLARGKPDPKLLLPPLSTLAPPGKLAQADGGLPLVTLGMGVATNAEQSVQQMASTLWAEHGPRIKASGAVAAGQVSQFAGRVLHHGADTLHDATAAMADPTKRAGLWARYRTLIVASGAGVVVLAGIGWVAASHEASRMANQKLHDFLEQTELASYVRYGSVSASPFGNVTIYDVSIRLSDNDTHPIRVGSLAIGGLSSSRTLPGALSLSASHIECSTEQANILTASGLSDTKLRGLGYSTVTGDIALSYSLSDRKLAVKSNASFVQIGGWNVSVDLADVPNTFLSGMTSVVQGGGFNLVSLMQMAQQFASIKLQSADIQFDNKGIIERAQAIPDSPFPQNRTQPDNATPFARWGTQGGTLKIVTQLEEPLPIMQARFPYSSLFNPAFSSLDSFIANTHATVTVD